MTAATLSKVDASLTLEEYLHTSFHPDVDFVDDHIEERYVGEGEHSVLQAEIAAWFVNHRRQWNVRVGSEYRTRVSSTRVRIPDVMVFASGSQLEKVRTSPPMICIEILSPEDRIPRVRQRLEEYLAMGVVHVWLVDPLARTASTYSAAGFEPVNGMRIEIDGSPIYLDLAHVFSALDE